MAKDWRFSNYRGCIHCGGPCQGGRSAAHLIGKRRNFPQLYNQKRLEYDLSLLVSDMRASDIKVDLTMLNCLYHEGVPNMKLLDGYVILQQNGSYNPLVLYMKDTERIPYPDQEAADEAARALASTNPGVRFYVAELVSAAIAERPVTTTVLRKRRDG